MLYLQCQHKFIVRGAIMPRVNINISDEMKKYFEEKSKETGVSQSALMVMAISEYLDQKKAINSMGSIIDQFKAIEGVYKVKGNK